MAREVIAEITFDETGAVKAVANTQDSLNRLEGGSSKAARALRSEWDRTASAFTARMFSIQNIARTLFGGATLAGGILALKSLYLDAARGDENFKRLTASMTVMHDTLVKIIQESPAFGAMMDSIADLPLIFAAFERTAEGKKGIAKTILGELPFGDLLLFKLELDKLRRQRDELLKPKGAPAAAPFQLPSGFLRPVGAEFLQGADFEGIAGSLSRFSPFADQAAESANRIRDSFMGIKQPLLDLSEQFKVLPNSTQITVTALTDVWAEVDALQKKYALYADTVSAASELVAAASASGVFSQAGAARAAMALVAAQSVIRGMFELAAATASAAWGDLRGAVLHKIAAGLYFATAAFQAKGAIGGTGGGGAGGGSFRGAAAFAPAPEARQLQIVNNITIEGNATEDTVDAIIDAIETRLKDGVSGGDFGGQLVRR